MKPQIAGFLVLVLVQITIGQELDSNALPWWPTQSGTADNSINVKTIQQNSEDDVTQQNTLVNQGKIFKFDLCPLYTQPPNLQPFCVHDKAFNNEYLVLYKYMQ